MYPVHLSFLMFHPWFPSSGSSYYSLFSKTCRYFFWKILSTYSKFQMYLFSCFILSSLLSKIRYIHQPGFAIALYLLTIIVVCVIQTLMWKEKNVLHILYYSFFELFFLFDYSLLIINIEYLVPVLMYIYHKYGFSSTEDSKYFFNKIWYLMNPQISKTYCFCQNDFLLNSSRYGIFEICYTFHVNRSPHYLFEDRRRYIYRFFTFRR